MTVVNAYQIGQLFVDESDGGVGLIYRIENSIYGSRYYMLWNNCRTHDSIEDDTSLDTYNMLEA